MKYERENDTYLGRYERKLLAWLCKILPSWVTSDMLTLFGILGSALSFYGYLLSYHGAKWLWLSIAGIAINWLGDSLDGSLARHLKAERPKYGFFLDHMTDTLAIGLIIMGIGLSPYAHFTSSLLLLIAYYLLVILSMVTCITSGVFRISFNGIGPTEIRILAVACTLAVMTLPLPAIKWGENTLTFYDTIMITLAILMLLTGGVQAIRTARRLAIEDPPVRHK